MVGRRRYKCVSWRSLGKTILIVSGIFVSSARATPNSVVGLSTSRTAPIPAVPAQMEATPDALSFANVPVGDTYTQTVRITNVSEGVLQIKAITASSADFRVTGIMLPVVVAPGTGESFTISYQAKAEGRREGQIGIVTSSGDTALVLKVRAVAAAGQRELTASEAAIDFEDIAIGSSTKKEVSLTNSGNRELRISGISVSGADFSVSGAGGVNLSPGQNITLDVNFAPKSAGRKAGTLQVSGAEGGSLLEIPLAATGAASSQSQVKLNWEESPVSVAGYAVYRSAEPSGPYMRVSTGPVPSTEYVDTGLAAGHTYYYVVAAVDANQGESEYSVPISATVPEA
jgi:Abnormal spindle-like microcephaly-assoc'd, ASPM-SPD-2-Hydin/Transmembrane protein 131-like N-terminal